jgi:hypothetical protein
VLVSAFHPLAQSSSANFLAILGTRPLGPCARVWGHGRSAFGRGYPSAGSHNDQQVGGVLKQILAA